MKLTIIPIDGTVCVDGVCHTKLIWSDTPVDVHALQWQDTSGWIEYNDEKVNEDITVIPSWAENAKDAWTIEELPKPYVPPTAEQNKEIAIYKLEETDWAATTDIGNPAMANPYLANQAEFIAYRNSIRQIVINPIAGDISWNEIPKATWLKV